jgi:dipeptidase
LGQGYDTSVAFWNFLAVGNYAGRFYKFAMQEVKRTQDYIHAHIVQEAADMEKRVLALLSDAEKDAKDDKKDKDGDKKEDKKEEKSADKDVVKTLTEFTNTQGEYIMEEWRQLLPRLITT